MHDVKRFQNLKINKHGKKVTSRNRKLANQINALLNETVSKIPASFFDSGNSNLSTGVKQFHVAFNGEKDKIYGEFTPLFRGIGSSTNNIYQPKSTKKVRLKSLRSKSLHLRYHGIYNMKNKYDKDDDLDSFNINGEFSNQMTDIRAANVFIQPLDKQGRQQKGNVCHMEYTPVDKYQHATPVNMNNIFGNAGFCRDLEIVSDEILNTFALRVVARQSYARIKRGREKSASAVSCPSALYMSDSYRAAYDWQYNDSCCTSASQSKRVDALLCNNRLTSSWASELDSNFTSTEEVLVQKLLTTRVAVLLPILSDVADEIIWSVQNLSIYSSKLLVGEVILMDKLNVHILTDTIVDNINYLMSDLVLSIEYSQNFKYCSELIANYGYNFTAWLFMKHCLIVIRDRMLDGIAEIIVANYTPLPSIFPKEESLSRGVSSFTQHQSTINHPDMTPVDAALSQFSDIQSKFIDSFTVNSQLTEAPSQNLFDNKSVTLQNNNISVGDIPNRFSEELSEKIKNEELDVRKKHSETNELIPDRNPENEFAFGQESAVINSLEDELIKPDSAEIPDMLCQRSYSANDNHENEVPLTDLKPGLNISDQLLASDNFNRNSGQFDRLTISQFDKSDSISEAFFRSDSAVSCHIPTPSQVLDNILLEKASCSLPPISTKTQAKPVRNNKFADTFLGYTDMECHPSSKSGRLLRNGNKRRTSNLFEYFNEANIPINIQQSINSAESNSRGIYIRGYSAFDEENKCSSSRNYFNASLYSSNNWSECSVDVKGDPITDTTHPSDSNLCRTSRLSRSVGESIHIADSDQLIRKSNQKVIYCAHGNLPVTYPQNYNNEINFIDNPGSFMQSKQKIELDKNAKHSILSDVVNTILHKLKAETIGEDIVEPQNQCNTQNHDENLTDDISQSLTYLTNCSLPKSFKTDTKGVAQIPAKIKPMKLENLDAKDDSKHIKVSIENIRKVDIAFDKEYFDGKESFKISNDGADISFGPGNMVNNHLAQSADHSPLKSEDYFKPYPNVSKAPGKQSLVDQFSPKQIWVPSEYTRSESSARPFFLRHNDKSPTSKFMCINKNYGNIYGEKKTVQTPKYLTSYLNACKSGVDTIVYETHPSEIICDPQSDERERSDNNCVTQELPTSHCYVNNSSTSNENQLRSTCSDVATNLNDFKTTCETIRENSTITQEPVSILDNQYTSVKDIHVSSKNDQSQVSKSATPCSRGKSNHPRTHSCPRFYSLPDIGESRIPRRIFSAKGLRDNNLITTSNKFDNNCQPTSIEKDTCTRSKEVCTKSETHEKKLGKNRSVSLHAQERKSNKKKSSFKENSKASQSNKIVADNDRDKNKEATLEKHNCNSEKTTMSRCSLENNRTKSDTLANRNSMRSNKTSNGTENQAKMQQGGGAVSLITGETFIDIINRKLTDEIGVNSGLQVAGTEEDITSRTVLATLTEKNVENAAVIHPTRKVNSNDSHQLIRKYLLGDRTAQSSISSTLPPTCSGALIPCNRKVGYNSPCCNISCWGTTDDTCTCDSSPIPDVEIETRCSSLGETGLSRKNSRVSGNAAEHSSKTSNFPGYIRHTASSRNKIIINKKISPPSQMPK